MGGKDIEVDQLGTEESGQPGGGVEWREDRVDGPEACSLKGSSGTHNTEEVVSAQALLERIY